ncbi:hypothetical protein WG904_19260 [Pedobacter sp. Du54]|uniref:hypothetical protein n=1 Tax=Pedobacter anseongensis TaxID=3133439 RepID=UPI00309F0FFF
MMAAYQFVYTAAAHRGLQNLRFLLLAYMAGIDKGFAFSDLGSSVPERLMLIWATRKNYFSFMN